LNTGTTYYYSLTSYDSNDYTLTVSNGDFSTTVTSIVETLRATSLRIYPNPVSDGFHIAGIVGEAHVIVTDIAGKTVLSRTVNPDEFVSVSHLQKGIYLVNVNGKTVKMIKR
jgi:hypothetical protein